MRPTPNLEAAGSERKASLGHVEISQGRSAFHSRICSISKEVGAFEYSFPESDHPAGSLHRQRAVADVGVSCVAKDAKALRTGLCVNLAAEHAGETF